MQTGVSIRGRPMALLGVELVHIDGQASLPMKIGFLVQDCVKSRRAVNPGFSSLSK